MILALSFELKEILFTSIIITYIHDTMCNMTERTLVIIKPDGVERRLAGEIIKRFEQIGLTLQAMKMLKPDEDLIEKHYTLDPEWFRLTGEKSIKNSKEKGHPTLSEIPEEAGRMVLNHLKNYLTKGPAIAMVWEGPHAVQIVRKLVGSTEPLSSDVGTIRGDFVLDSYELSNKEGRAIRNLVHASTSAKEAESEIKHWFSESDILI
jgi:nucleoside-diphosphate kinase